jgi:hypothetical protein
MSNAFAIVAAALAMAISLVSTVCTAVLLMASGANASDRAISQIKWMMTGIAAAQVLSLVVSIWLLLRGRGWVAAAVGATPAVLVAILVVVLVRLEW